MRGNFIRETFTRETRLRQYRSLPRRLPKVVLVVLSLAGLAGCNETVGGLAQNSGAPRLAARPGVSPTGATVAFVTVEGAPADIVERFSQATMAEAQRRQVSIAQPAAADYLVRGYLSASLVQGGAAFSYVWDVFDNRRRRVRRTQDTLAVAGASEDPWRLANPVVLNSLAARSADDLAAILTNTPEAAAAQTAAEAIAASAPKPATAQPPANAQAYSQ